MASVISIDMAVESAERQLEMVLDGVNWTPCSSMVNLRTPVEWNRRCDRCEKKTLFVADRVCVYGLVARCKQCSDQILAHFTHTTSGAV